MRGVACLRPHADVHAGDPGANSGHSLSAIFPVSSSPIAHFGKEHLGTNFGKATPAGVRQRDRGSDVPAKRSYSRRAQSVKEAL